MNSKIIGSFLILGPLLLVIPWITLGVDVSGMSPSEHIAAVLEKSTQSEASGILNVFGAIFFFTGLYYLSKSLKSDDSISNSLAALGGLLIILCLPMFTALVGAEVIAIESAQDFGNEAGATILAASTIFEMCGFLMIVGIFLLGASLVYDCDNWSVKKWKGIVGALFMITTILSFIDFVSAGAAGEVVSLIGWMGFFLMTLITGILTLVPSLKK
tara:strand:- start:12 stop:656 length:645 start_codon:yes stop_codon:yes gene_type:complete